LRHIVQAQVIILLLYGITRPSAPIKLLWTIDPILSLSAILAGTHVQILSLVPAIIMLIIAVILGRAFCGWICPIGFIQDIASFGKKTNLLPERFRLLKYTLLVGGLIMPIFSGWTFLEWFTPLPLFTQTFGTFLGHVNGIHVGITIFLLSVTFTVVSERRAWCRYVCPLGALLSLPSAHKIFRISLNKKKCIKCLECDERCTMGVIDIKNHSELKWENECILCMACRDTCPVNAINIDNSSALSIIPEKKHLRVR
jgi:NapH/MauN family ferredoxin-type protein